MTIHATYSVDQTVPVLIEGGIYQCVIDTVYTVNTKDDQRTTYHGTAKRTVTFSGKVQEWSREWGGTDEDIQKAIDFKPLNGKDKPNITEGGETDEGTN